MGALIDTLRDPVALMAILVSLAIFATILSLAMPLLSSDRLPARMRAVADEREKIRQRERARLAEEGRGSLRGKESKAYMRSLVERLSLRKALLDEKGEEKLKQAGFRSEAATTTFLFARFVLPFGFLILAIFYVFHRLEDRSPPALQGGHMPGHRLRRVLSADHLRLQRPAEAPAIDQAGLPRFSRSALDLRRKRHVDRARVPPGLRGESEASRYRWPRSSA